MDRLDKVVSMVCEYNATCGGRIECKGCKYYDRKCNLKYLMDALMEWDRTIPKEESIVLKNIDTHNMTSDKLYEECLRENEEFKDAVNYFTDVMASDRGNKDYLRGFFIEKILAQLQANINLASFYGITANDIMKHYNHNTEYSESEE